MNQSYARVTAPYTMRKVFGVQLYKNNARALLSRILCILNSDCLQHARSIRGVYEYFIVQLPTSAMSTMKDYILQELIVLYCLWAMMLVKS